MDALFAHCASGDTDAARVCIHSGCPIDARRPSDGSTALHISVEFNRTDCVKLLTGAGADLDARNDEEQTALHLAAESGHVSILALLLSAGASVDVRDKWVCSFCGS